MKIPTQPQMRSPGAFGGVIAGAVRMTRDTPWEMHPGGDECLHLLSGAIDVVVEDGGFSQTIELRAGGACVIPRGKWHRQVVREPGELLFITPGAGTQHRAIDRNVLVDAARDDTSRSRRRAPRSTGDPTGRSR
jgi:mannose-6-phosphate isomerase-like protein (cupin superfamily)